MDEKIQRYLHRISQMMQMPKKGAGNCRPSKSPIVCKPNHLDKYLKFELAAKIILKIIHQNDQQLVHQFFNAIRISDYRQKEKIYKFISVEQSDHPRTIYPDPAILSKVLTTTLKNIIRKRFADFINCLQSTSSKIQNTPKAKLNRRQSAKDSSPVQGRMRTLTNAGRAQNVTNKLNDFGSYIHEQVSNKTTALAVKVFYRFLNTKIQMLHYLVFHEIKAFKLHVNSPPKQQQASNHKLQSTQINIPINSVFFLKLDKIMNRFLSFSFQKINHYHYLVFYRIKMIRNFISKVSKVVQRHRLKFGHNFLSGIRAKLKEAQVMDQDLLSLSLRGRSSVSNQGRAQSQIIKISAAQSNPLSKINFQSFIDKLVKLMIILSKMLAPLKEAFSRIDQYASFAFRIQQSLQVVPQKQKLDAFLQLKLWKTPISQPKQVYSQYAPRLEAFDELVFPMIKIRLIEGFTHIKIMSKERELKIKIFPAKDNIVLLAKRFIIDRDQYTNQSHQNWQELKSMFMSPRSNSNLTKNSTIA